MRGEVYALKLNLGHDLIFEKKDCWSKM